MWDIFEYKIICAVLTLMALMVICMTFIETNNKEDYLKNLETKLNTYEQSYINYSLEDSVRQMK